MSTFLAFRTATLALLRPRGMPPHWPKFRAVQTFAPTKEKKDNRPPRDEKIQYNFVRFVDPTTNRLTDPTRLSHILSTIDRTKEYVELISAEQGSIPIVKIISKKKEFDKMKKLKQRAREVAMNNRHKEVQLTWGSTSSDMAHKLERVREELEKGLKVDLVFAPKKGQILPRPEERQAQIQEIVDMMADVGKEWKLRDQRRAVVAIFLQGNAPAASGVQIVQKIPKKIRRKEELKAREMLKSQRRNPDGDIVDINKD